MLFGVKIGENFVSDYEKLKWYAEHLEIDVAPLLFKGSFEDDKQVNYEKLKSIITQTVSYLGGPLIEGIVIKNYNQDVTKGYPQGICIGKFVREEFKEKLHKEWKTISEKSKLEDFIEGFRTEARWIKAIGHLREKGELENAPKDIGKLLKEIQIDMIGEEKEFIKDSLYKLFIDNIKRKSIAGFPEFYKDYLMKKQFEMK